jgi:hypothetical protein
VQAGGRSGCFLDATLNQMAGGIENSPSRRRGCYAKCRETSVRHAMIEDYHPLMTSMLTAMRLIASDIRLLVP